MKNDDSVVASSSSQLSTDLGGEFVILGLSDEVYYGVDDVGARIWELIQQPRTVSSIIETIASEYDVDLDACATDTASFLDELAAKSLVDVVSAGG